MKHKILGYIQFKKIIALYGLLLKIEDGCQIIINKPLWP